MLFSKYPYFYKLAKVKKAQYWISIMVFIKFNILIMLYIFKIKNTSFFFLSLFNIYCWIVFSPTSPHQTKPKTPPWGMLDMALVLMVYMKTVFCTKLPLSKSHTSLFSFPFCSVNISDPNPIPNNNSSQSDEMFLKQNMFNI